MVVVFQSQKHNACIQGTRQASHIADQAQDPAALHEARKRLETIEIIEIIEIK